MKCNRTEKFLDLINSNFKENWSKRVGVDELPIWIYEINVYVVIALPNFKNNSMT